MRWKPSTRLPTRERCGGRSERAAIRLPAGGPAAVGKKEYPRSQEVAEACAFLGADGLLVPSARVPASNNLIVFCEQEMRIVKEVVRSHGVVDLS